MRLRTLLLPALLALMGWMRAAYAAESYTTCTNTVSTTPTTISTSGTWCLKGNPHLPRTRRSMRNHGCGTDDVDASTATTSRLSETAG